MLVPILTALTLAAGAPTVGFANVAADQSRARAIIEAMRKDARVPSLREPLRAALEDPLDATDARPAAELARARSRIDAAKEAFSRFDYAGVIARLGQAEAILETLPPSPALLHTCADAEVLRGVVRAYQHQTSDARIAFALAQRLDEDRKALDPAQYPPQLVELYRQARADGESRLGRVELTSEPPGASLAVDGHAAGVAPLRTSIAAGDHLVTATLDGRAPRSVILHVATARPSTLALQLAALPVEEQMRSLRLRLRSAGDDLVGARAAAAELAALAAVEILVVVGDAPDGKPRAAILHARDGVLSGWETPRGTTSRLASDAIAPAAPPALATSERRRSPLLLGSGAGALAVGVAFLGAAIYSGVHAAQLSDSVASARAGWTVALDGMVRDGQSAERNAIVFYSLSGALVVGGATLCYFGARARRPAAVRASLERP
jgi:hypothetical protein